MGAQAKCPMYVHKRVWQDNTVLMRELAGTPLPHSGVAHEAVEQLTGTALLTTIRCRPLVGYADLNPHRGTCAGLQPQVIL